MENITLGQIAIGIAFLVALISGIGALMKSVKTWINKAMKEPLEIIVTEIKNVNDRIDKVDMNTCKNFLVARLAEIEQGNSLDDIKMQRFWEEYEHYAEIGGNSYIRRKVEQLKAEGKL